MAYCLFNIGVINYKLGNYKEAENNFKNSLEIIK